MLALEEKPRALMLLAPDLVLAGKSQDIAQQLEEAYIEVKARKQVYITAEDADSFFHYLPQVQREASVEAFTRGLTEVLIVEHLDQDIIDLVNTFAAEKLKPAYDDLCCYCSSSPWEAMRDIEFFFPYLDTLPVERTLVLIKPDGLQKGEIDGQTLEGQIEAQVAVAGLFIVGKQPVVLQDAQAQTLCQDLGDDAQGSVGVLLQEPGTLAMCIEGPGAVGKALLMCGPTNAGVCKDRAPSTLRAIWGTDSSSNAVHASATLEAAERELKCLFPEGTLQLQRTLCIVKPHAMKDLLQIRMDIEACGFTILKEKHTELTEERAKEFYRDRKALPIFNATVQEAISGKCCCLVLCRLEAVAVLQQLMGPEVVKDARALRPRSMRARYGVEAQRNAVHGSQDPKAASREVRFFFPEMGCDPVPGEDEVRDYLFRKSAGASMDLKSLSSMDATDYTLDPTLQQMISSGLLALCQVRPKGLAAVSWFKEWLVQSNPNSAKKKAFLPPDRNAQDRPAKPKKVIDVDVSEEQDAVRNTDFKVPPYVVLVLGQSACCQQLAEELNFVHLDVQKMLGEEVAAETRLGMEIQMHVAKKDTVPDAVILKMLEGAIKKKGVPNRFLLSSYAASAHQAVLFEKEVTPISLILNVTAPDADPGEKEVADYYSAIGKLRTVDGTNEDKAAVYAQAKSIFNCRFLYLMGPPGVPLAKVAARLQAKYGYSSIDLAALLHKFADSEEPDAAKVKQALAKGKPIEASIACPLVLEEIHRELPVGVHNFVICNFPEILKQVEFLEYRIPCTSRPLLLDFSRADAEELAAMLATGSDEAEVRTTAFFAPDVQAMIASLPNLVRIPFSLAEMQGYGPGPSTLDGLEAQLVDHVWTRVCEKVVPSLTLCLGLPHSGTNVLSDLIASRMANTCVVDCNQLLDKEMERKTDIGLKMTNMLSQGQVVPLSMTVQLLKEVVNLTCSDSLVVDNCPLAVDQLELLTSEFRVDKAFHIAGNEKATAAWKEKFLARCKSGDPDADTKMFKDRSSRLSQIVTYFGRLGKLERLEVTETPTKDTLVELVDKAMWPEFIVVTGLSTKITPRLAEHVAKLLGPGPPVSAASVPPQETSEETFRLLREHAGKQLAESGGSTTVVLDRYITSEEMAREFVAFFGPPKLVVDVSVDAEYWDAEFKEANAEMEEEQQNSQMEQLTASYGAVLKAFSEQCPSAMVKLANFAIPEEEQEKAADAEGLIDQVKAKLLPTVYVVVAPGGEDNFSMQVSDSIAATIKTPDGSRPLKMTILNTAELLKPGRHSPEIEERLLRVLSASPNPQCIPTSLWIDIFREAIASSANPMGPFLVCSFPIAPGGPGAPTVRDQFCILENLANLSGILRVKLSDEAFLACVSESAAELAQYRAFDADVWAQVQLQFDKVQLCEAEPASKDGRAQAAAKAAADFLAFLGTPEE